MIDTISRLLVAQNIGEYGALSGLASALDRFASAAEDVARNPHISVPLGIAVLVGAYFLLRRR
jgi:hypothetical protein